MSQARLQGCASRFRTDLHYSRVHARGGDDHDGGGVGNDRNLSENDCLRQAFLHLDSVFHAYDFAAHENTFLRRGDESHGKRTSQSY